MPEPTYTSASIPTPRISVTLNLALDELCRDVETRLEQLQVGSVAVTPESVAQCESQLTGMVHLIAAYRSRWAARTSWDNQDKEDRIALQRVQKAIRRLATQLDHGNNLCLGWIQLCITSGYTEQGQPVLTHEESKASYEA